MFVSILSYVLPEVSAILKVVIKNPSQYAGLKSVLTEINNDLTVILAGL